MTDQTNCVLCHHRIQFRVAGSQQQITIAHTDLCVVCYIHEHDRRKEHMLELRDEVVELKRIIDRQAIALQHLHSIK